ncbi:class III homeobox-leucine zipper protein, partial [Striga asiatica]
MVIVCERRRISVVDCSWRSEWACKTAVVLFVGVVRFGRRLLSTGWLHRIRTAAAGRMTVTELCLCGRERESVVWDGDGGDPPAAAAHCFGGGGIFSGGLVEMCVCDGGGGIFSDDLVDICV